MSKAKPVLAEAEPTNESPEMAAELEGLLLYLKQSRGFDFTAYKRATLMRRVLVRMQTIGLGSFADYLDYLQVDSHEFTRLFNTILINVTGFFRDPQAWELVARDVLPGLLRGTGVRDPGVSCKRQRQGIYGSDVGCHQPARQTDAGQGDLHPTGQPQRR